MSGDTCLAGLCPASGSKPKPGGFKGGGMGNKYIQLNVGGSLYYTTVRVLTRHDTMLKAMFSGRMEVLTDKEGWILIDRCGKHFGTILNYLRDDTITLPQNRQEVKELMAEAKYYLIQGLVDMCQAALQDKKESYQPVCNIPIITSPKEEERLIEASTKPVVKLLYNRSNNKYSYTSNSDDHLLKNIELFDKLSLSFNGRVLFIKDVIGDEICCWSFYGQGRKLAEVCCTSIVYATEKKQTKVPGGRFTTNLSGHGSQGGDVIARDQCVGETWGGVCRSCHGSCTRVMSRKRRDESLFSKRARVSLKREPKRSGCGARTAQGMDIGL
uniref:BTB/POZ domain-containing adapter for CUL3-mediated RhoA degradation protein 2 n=1 Tax=Sarcophilus harrisii TaxID=9305 RepID=A0A7N4NW83_SARHA